MRNTFYIVLLLFVGLQNLYSQNKFDLWPIQGAKTGKDILFRPQEYIGEELNFGDLFIGAKENTLVLCPKDGKIINIVYRYFHALVYSHSRSLANNIQFTDINKFDKNIRTNFAEDIS